jgi:hypothetical protein
VILKGEQLEAALAGPERSVTLLDSDGKHVRDVAPEQVGPLLLQGYEAGGSKRRVRYLRPIPGRCTGAASMPVTVSTRAIDPTSQLVRQKASDREITQERQINSLKAQNEALQRQMENQAGIIRSLRAKLGIGVAGEQGVKPAPAARNTL